MKHQIDGKPIEPYLKPSLFLVRLHGDLRWAELLKRIGLPPNAARQ